MNTENSKTNEPHTFTLTKILKDLKDPNKNMPFAFLSIYYTWKNVKSAYNNNKFKTSASTSNDEFDLSDGSYSASDIQDYFEHIIKKHETVANKPLCKFMQIKSRTELFLK